jgi:hypothetical protein
MRNLILLFLALSFQLNFSLLFSGEISLVGKVKLEESDIKNLSPFLEVSQISKSGKFTIANFIDGSRDSIVMDSNGRYIRFKQADSSSKLSTNILGTIVENGILKVIQIEKQEFIGETNDGLAIFNTFSTNGYLSVVNQRISLSEQKFKISATSKDLIDSVGTSFNKVKITKYDSSGKILRTSSFDGKLPEISDESDGGPDVNFQIFVNIEDGYICFYRIDFNEAMISNNSIRFNVKSSKGNSITAQLLSESQKILRIQSSTNLIDWNTFKTIKNEPSLEIVVPANKPKEFIRAIE